MKHSEGSPNFLIFCDLLYLTFSRLSPRLCLITVSVSSLHPFCPSLHPRGHCALFFFVLIRFATHISRFWSVSLYLCVPPTAVHHSPFV